MLMMQVLQKTNILCYWKSLGTSSWLQVFLFLINFSSLETFYFLGYKVYKVYVLTVASQYRNDLWHWLIFLVLFRFAGAIFLCPEVTFSMKSLWDLRRAVNLYIFEKSIIVAICLLQCLYYWPLSQRSWGGQKRSKPNFMIFFINHFDFLLWWRQFWRSKHFLIL